MNLAKDNINAHLHPPKGIWTEVVKGLTLEQRALLPDYPAFRELIQRQRTLPETASLDKPEIKDIKIEGQHRLDANNVEWVLYDSRDEGQDDQNSSDTNGAEEEEDKPVIIIFGSPEGIKRLKEYPNWSLDGTFYVAPKPWKQLYLINALIDKRKV
uniref:Uncharacterized protein n=1 Tax=Panagrolaimus sp. ES5 TaxID=591445 RepID=A0AC34GDJ7_9BILA